MTDEERDALVKAVEKSDDLIFAATARRANWLSLACRNCGHVVTLSKCAPSPRKRCDTCGATDGAHAGDGLNVVCPIAYEDWERRALAAEALVYKAGTLLQMACEQDSGQFDPDRCGSVTAHDEVAEVYAAAVKIENGDA